MQLALEGVGTFAARGCGFWGGTSTGGGAKPLRREPLAVDAVEQSRSALLAAAEGDARARSRLAHLKLALEAAAANGNACACEILCAICASGLGGERDVKRAREWIVRAVRLLEDHVERPVSGRDGFMLLPTDRPENAYRPLYTAHGVLITNEIGTARTIDGVVCFDRWGRPVVEETAAGPTHATTRAVAARIARQATLQDFAWSCRRTTREFREMLLDARVIAHGRLGYRRRVSSARAFRTAA